MGLWHTHGSPNLGQKTRPNNNQQQKKRIWKIVDFTVPADHRIKLKQCEKKDKYLNLARELKKLWNMKVTIVPIVIGAFGTVTIGLLKGLEDLEVGGRVETIQPTALLPTSKILRKVLEILGESSEKPSTDADVKNSKGVIIIMIIIIIVICQTPLCEKSTNMGHLLTYYKAVIIWYTIALSAGDVEYTDRISAEG